jgi:Flp pilus assembly protein TadD
MSLRLTSDAPVQDDAISGFTISEVADIISVVPERIRAWVTAGLIQPVKSGDEWLFDFRQVSAARTICDLIRSGLSLGRVRRQLEQMRSLCNDEGQQTLDSLPVVEQAGQLLIRLTDSELAAADGQLHFSFDGMTAPTPLVATPATAAQWHAKAISQEQSGDLAAAAESFRIALQVGGPDARISFDLGHALAALGEVPAALERYMQAVELDRDFADAWNNLGVLLCEMNRPMAACTAFRRALAAEPFNLRAHYNLADTLDEMGRVHDARAHWQAYLQCDSNSEAADYARSRLA